MAKKQTNLKDITIQNKDNDSFVSTINKINQNLSYYRSWYQPQFNKGRIIKLESIDEELSASFIGLSYFAFYSENDPKYHREYRKNSGRTPVLLQTPIARSGRLREAACLAGTGRSAGRRTAGRKS